MASKKRVVLIDGHAIIYRAYYAIPSNLSTASGLHTNAIYGFATMFRKMLGGKTPEYGAVVFDPPGKTFRDEKYPAYKANRPRMDPELREQLRWIDRLVEAYSFPLLRVPGFEADDVIGTLTRMALEQGMEVFIVSGDKDFAQLVGDDVRMIDSLRDINYDAELVRKKWGVPPHQFVDLLAMVGDKVDNIPGVPGVGQKGAAKLLDTYGSLDAIIEHADELKGRQKTAFTEHVEMARLSRDLATIDVKVPIEETLDDLAIDPPAPNALNSLYKELEFYSLLAGDESRGDAPDEDAEYTLLEQLAQFEAFMDDVGEGRIAAVPIIDRPSAVRGALVGVALSAEVGKAVYVEMGGDTALREAVVTMLADPKRAKVVHDAKALAIALRRLGSDLEGEIDDLLLMSFLIDPTKLIPHGLGQIVREFLHRTIPPAKNLLGGGKSARNFSEIPTSELLPWACQLADSIYELRDPVWAKLEEEGHVDVYHQVDLQLSWVLADMELAGIAVDPVDLRAMGEEFQTRLDALESTIHELAGRTFNIGSPKQLSAVLFDELGLPVIKRTKSGYSTKAEVLERLAPKHEIARHILEHRKLAKLINTYTNVLAREVSEETGRIHSTFQQTVGATGRLITTDPDLQRTPVRTSEGARIRKTFIAPEGRAIISADWSQIELRLLAHFTEDPGLVEAFTSGLDVHARTAGELFEVEPGEVTKEQRNVGKLVNFSTIYGQGATALSQIIGVTRKEAQSYIERYFEAYAGVRTWLDGTIARAHGDGFVTTILGRRRYIPELSSNSFMDRQAGERIAANTPIQGSAADICKLAMLHIAVAFEEQALPARMVLQIHDELLIEADADRAEEVAQVVRDKMTNVYPLHVPLVTDVGIGATWAAAKD